MLGCSDSPLLERAWYFIAIGMVLFLACLLGELIQFCNGQSGATIVLSNVLGWLGLLLLLISLKRGVFIRQSPIILPPVVLRREEQGGW